MQDEPLVILDVMQATLDEMVKETFGNNFAVIMNPVEDKDLYDCVISTLIVSTQQFTPFFLQLDRDEVAMLMNQMAADALKEIKLRCEQLAELIGATVS